MLTEQLTTEVTPERVQQGVTSLLERGYTVIERSLSPEQCEIAAELLDEMILNRQAQDHGGFGYGIHPLFVGESRLADFYCDPLAIAIMEALFGDEAHLVHSGARVSDASNAPRIGWHQHRYPDEQIASLDNPEALGAYPTRVLMGLYIEGCNAETGPLIVYPRRYDDKVAAPYEDIGAYWPGEVEVSCPPGSCVIFTTDLWHSAKGGTTSRRRHLFGAHVQGWNNPRPHSEDHVHESPDIDAAAARNPLFAHLIQRRAA